jgi:hypothetical protein
MTEFFEWPKLPDLNSTTRFRLWLSLFLMPFLEKSSKSIDLWLFSVLSFSYSTFTVDIWSTVLDEGVGAWGGLVAGGKSEDIEGTLLISICEGMVN